MKHPKHQLLGALLALAVVLCAGWGATSLYRFDEWRGNAAANYIWTCTNATTGEGAWSNKVGVSSAFLIGPELNGQGTYIFNTGGGVTVFSNTAEGLLFSWNGALQESVFWDPLYAPSITVTNNLKILFTTDTIATNGTANSNLTMNLDVGIRDIYLTNNISITNFTGMVDNNFKSVQWRIVPVGTTRTVVYPAFGSSQFGQRAATNDNNTLWTTLTNPHTYRLTVQWFGTNSDWAISVWH